MIAYVDHRLSPVRRRSTRPRVPSGVCISALRIRFASTCRIASGSPSVAERCRRRAKRSRAQGRSRGRRRRHGRRTRERSTGTARASGSSSRRASISRFSTSAPMRAASASIRAIARFSATGSWAGPDPEQLGVAAHRRQRRAELVRGIGEEALSAFLAARPVGERLLDPARASCSATAPAGRSRFATSAGLTRRERSPSAISLGDALHLLERPQPDPDHDPAEPGQRHSQRCRRPAPRRTSAGRASRRPPSSGIATITVRPRSRAAAPRRGSGGPSRAWS